MKQLLAVLLFCGMIALVMSACGRGTAANASGGSTSSAGTVTIHTTATNFAQPSVTLKSGQSLKVVNDASDMHILSLGTWSNGAAHPEKEPGAPSLHNEQLAGNSSLTIGPWNTPGTYQVYCTVHQGMKLTVIVSR
jgi:plastocyanin